VNKKQIGKTILYVGLFLFGVGVLLTPETLGFSNTWLTIPGIIMIIMGIVLTGERVV
jgi:Sec-independent protein secretion pathway component TatC